MKLLIQHGSEWLSFNDPVEMLTARTLDEVQDCLIRIEQSGLWAAGFVSYEAAGAFDEALTTHASGTLPLLQFGLFKHVERTFLSAHSGTQECLPQEFGSGRQARADDAREVPHYQIGEWAPSVSRKEYIEAISSIKEHIAAGDTYQVNYTFRLNTDFEGDPFAFFCDLISAQQGGAGRMPAVRGGYGAYIETDDFAICSASPELFFELKDGVITSRPMKGTRPRGLTLADDQKQREALQNSDKDRAENIMIVDMIRNDIGRIAEAGSVETVSRFDIEKYPTVWQMTSTVQGKVAAASCRSSKRQARAVTPAKASTFENIFEALFPCASITGAPKAKTMEIIQELERTACGHASPRGIYTGSIGFISPDGKAQFNVAIRTAVLDRNAGVLEYGIGGGIVWDSDADAEYEEALSKARILRLRPPEKQHCCLETMLWEDGKIFLLERHLKRLAESAEYFDFECDLNQIRNSLSEHCRPRALTRRAPGGGTGPTKIRLLLNKDGLFKVEAFAGVTARACRLQRQDASSTLALAKEPVDSGDVFLYHKTTNRAVYEREKADFPDADDVLLYNERGEVTESCIANVVVELDGKKVTPPVSCGLLAGTFRDELLERGEIQEQVVMLDDLKRADSVWLINSVRKWQTVQLV